MYIIQSFTIFRSLLLFYTISIIMNFIVLEKPYYVQNNLVFQMLFQHKNFPTSNIYHIHYLQKLFLLVSLM